MATETPLSAIIVQQGKILDFIDGVTQREEKPEEYVRQEIAKSLVREYRYPKSTIEVEFVLRLGSKRPRADLAIFAEGDEHRQDRILVIIECKSANIRSSDRKDGIGQLQSYMSACPNATLGMWTNGTERFCFKKVSGSRGIEFLEVPDISTYGEDVDEAERPKFEQLKAASSDALLFAFRRCHNYIAGNQGLQKPEAFWELLKLIFCKIHDERNSEAVQFFASAVERSSLNGQLKCRARIEKLFAEVREDFPQIFKPSEELELNPAVLAYAVSQLQMYSLLDSDVDVKGKAYEEIVGSNLRGDRGEFFTPRNICQMAVEMLDPSERDVILDPACGTGGFLITAMNYVASKVRTAEIGKWGDTARGQASATARMDTFLRQKLIGLDLNPNLVKASKMNMVMNNDGSGGLFQANSLQSPAVWSTDLRGRNLLNGVDVLVTNPPFGSKIPIDDPAILETYDLGHNWSYDEESDLWLQQSSLQPSQPPEILFIERCLKFLRPGTGRAAMVLPDGILGSPGMGYVRQWLMRQTQILASVDLHPDTFQPHTSVQTSVLIFRRKSAEQIALEDAAGGHEDYSIFMAVADRVGHDKRGNLIYVRDDEGNEVVEVQEERQRDYIDGKPVFSTFTVQRKLIDDQTPEIASTYRAWVTELIEAS